MVIKRVLSLVVMLFLIISAMGQQIPDGYNPFIPVNLDDPAKLEVSPVVESSYHRYWIAGDPNYTDPSTFVWYAANGTFGTYDTLTDVWTPYTPTIIIGSGTGAVLMGTTIKGVHNMSEIWVRWNDGSTGSTGYVAVYEVSSSGCVVADQITGFKHPIVAPPEMWFIVGNLEQCSDQGYSLTVQFNSINDYSFPYTFRYSYPGSDGAMLTAELQVNPSDLGLAYLYSFNLPPVQDLNVTIDETYTITLDGLKDRYGSTGKIAPLGVPMGQYRLVTLTVNHLPQTGDMTMDK